MVCKIPVQYSKAHLIRTRKRPSFLFAVNTHRSNKYRTWISLVLSLFSTFQQKVFVRIITISKSNLDGSSIPNYLGAYIVGTVRSLSKYICICYTGGRLVQEVIYWTMLHMCNAQMFGLAPINHVKSITILLQIPINYLLPDILAHLSLVWLDKWASVMTDCR